MEKPILLPDSPSFVDLCTLHQHAMRYYRLWIYACNTVLALATLVFTLFAVSVFVDPRISLLSGVELYQPTFIYAYVALILQCGVLQTIGCLGALRLNQRLLNTYWTLLLLLMIGDIIVGLVWAFRLDWIKSSLRPTLKQRLSLSYRLDPQFTQVWDWVQATEMCCGIEGPADYHQFNDSSFPPNDWPGSNTSSETGSPLPSPLPPLHLPSTCCQFTKWDSSYGDEPSRAQAPQIRAAPAASPHGGTGLYVPPEVNRRHHHTQPSFHRVPRAAFPPLPTPAASKRKSILSNASRAEKTEPVSLTPNNRASVQEAAEGSPSPSPWATLSSFCELPPELASSSTSSSGFPYHVSVHRGGCAEKILVWVDSATDVLFVIGFCIIVFLKGCFLAILRYEIKEMIQKIRLLNGDESLRTAAMNELIGLTSMYNSGSHGEEEELEGVAIETPGPAPIAESAVPVKERRTGSVGRNSVGTANASPAEPPPPRYKYPPFGQHLNSNNMVVRLQRQQSIQQRQQAELEEDFDSSSGLLTGPGALIVDKILRSASRLNSMSIPIPIPYPRNGNNNTSMEMTTTTALVNSTSITAGATPLATATSSKIH